MKNEQGPVHLPARILSGGQTGVDRAALDTAIALGIDHGGWCPSGRLAEDGPLPSTYLLRETDTPVYSQRTALNIQDSDGTLILHRGQLKGGTLLTSRLAQQARRPLMLVQLGETLDRETASSLDVWINQHAIQVLNVAGPRESQEAGIYLQARSFLDSFLAGRA